MAKLLTPKRDLLCAWQNGPMNIVKELETFCDCVIYIVWARGKKRKSGKRSLASF